jgi:polysaccharide deacetylase 2 family uncharacterized protein YibQ
MTIPLTGLAPVALEESDAPAYPAPPRFWLAWSVAAGGFAALAASLFMGIAGAFGDEPASRAPYVAIVIDDVGLDVAAARRAIALPAPVTLAILPYAEAAAEVDALATGAGRETIVHLPMEPLGLEDPGPDALATWLTPAAVRARVDAALAAVPGAVGVSNHMGSHFTACAACVTPVVDAAMARGAFVLDSLTTAESVFATVAAAAGAPTLTRDVFLDNDPSVDAVLDQLARAERTAWREGRAIAIGHPRAATLEALERWIPEAQARGVEVGVAGALVRPTEARVAALVGAGL